jgi:hypothetical protein
MMTSLHSGTFSGDVQNHGPARSSYHILHLMPHKKDQPPPDLRHFKPVEKRGDERAGAPGQAAVRRFHIARQLRPFRNDRHREYFTLLCETNLSYRLHFTGILEQSVRCP